MDHEELRDEYLQHQADIGEHMATLDQAMVERGLAKPGDTTDALQQALNAGPESTNAEELETIGMWGGIVGLTFDEQRTAAVDLVHDHPGVEHIWLNAFSCIRPTDAFAAEVGRTVIAKVMSHKHDDVLKARHIVIRVNAS